MYIYQLVRIGRIRSRFEQFKHRHYTLTQKLIKQGFWYSGLCIAFKRFVNIMQALSTNMDVVYENTLRRGYACQPLMVS